MNLSHAENDFWQVQKASCDQHALSARFRDLQLSRVDESDNPLQPVTVHVHEGDVTLTGLLHFRSEHGFEVRYVGCQYYPVRGQ